jgi:hypothetical protein
VHDVRTTVTTLSRMIDDLTDLTLGESEQLVVQRLAVDLVRLLEEVIERAANVTAGHPVGSRFLFPFHALKRTRSGSSRS